MPIVGLGSDLVRIAKVQGLIERRGERALKRLFTAHEREYCERERDSFSSYAGRFAVKEAVMKVLGTGWNFGVRWVDIEVVRKKGQAPEVRLHNRAQEVAEKKGIRRVHITITHDSGWAVAVAVAESNPFY